jgi:hypothetical protein
MCSPRRGPHSVASMAAPDAAADGQVISRLCSREEKLGRGGRTRQRHVGRDRGGRQRDHAGQVDLRCRCERGNRGHSGGDDQRWMLGIAVLYERGYDIWEP